MLNKHSDLSIEQEETVSTVIGCAIAVHRELKAVPRLRALHRYQVQSYLRRRPSAGARPARAARSVSPFGSSDLRIFAFAVGS